MPTAENISDTLDSGLRQWAFAIRSATDTSTADWDTEKM